MTHQPKQKSITTALSPIIFSLMLIFLLAACGPSDESTPNPTSDGTGTTSYPAPGEGGYPTIVTQSVSSAYPPEEQRADESERFMIDLPVTASTTTISGQAPKDLSIAVVDVTFGGVILGTGVTDDDGRFSIPVSDLTEGHRIGITVTDINDGRTFEEIAVELYDYRGEGFINVPSVGVFFDSTLVQPS